MRCVQKIKCKICEQYLYTPLNSSTFINIQILLEENEICNVIAPNRLTYRTVANFPLISDQYISDKFYETWREEDRVEGGRGWVVVVEESISKKRR